MHFTSLSAPSNRSEARTSFLTFSLNWVPTADTCLATSSEITLISSCALVCKQSPVSVSDSIVGFLDFATDVVSKGSEGRKRSRTNLYIVGRNFWRSRTNFYIVGRISDGYERTCTSWAGCWWLRTNLRDHLCCLIHQVACRRHRHSCPLSCGTTIWQFSAASKHGIFFKSAQLVFEPFHNGDLCWWRAPHWLCGRP